MLKVNGVLRGVCKKEKKNIQISANISPDPALLNVPAVSAVNQAFMTFVK